MIKLPARKDNSGDTRLAHLVVPYRLGRPELCENLETRLAASDVRITGEDYARRELLLFTAQRVEVLRGCLRYHLAPGGDLKLILPPVPGRLVVVWRRNFVALAQRGLGVLRGKDQREILVVAAPRRRRAGK